MSPVNLDQLVELPKVGHARMQQCIQLREKMGGKVSWSSVFNIGGVGWEALAD